MLHVCLVIMPVCHAYNVFAGTLSQTDALAMSRVLSPLHRKGDVDVVIHRDDASTSVSIEIRRRGIVGSATACTFYRACELACSRCLTQSLSQGTVKRNVPLCRSNLSEFLVDHLGNVCCRREFSRRLKTVKSAESMSMLAPRCHGR